MTKTNYRQIEKNILDDLDERTREILKRRFALSQDERETLESIGRDFQVTRERIRQIEKNGLERIRQEKEAYLREKLKDVYDYFRSWGKVKREDQSLKELGGSKYKNQIYFFLTIDPRFYYKRSNERVHPFWSYEQDRRSEVEEVIDALEKKLKEINSPVKKEDILSFNISNDQDFLESCLEIAYRVASNPHGHFGLVDWPQINPHGLKDKSYLVLKEKKEPLHFRDITKEINASFKDWGKSSQSRKALTQTVHNELIRDERFVLIGRGMYALKEWGYKPGTVAEVIERVLKEADRPLTRGEIVERVLDQRLVKESTIILNLSRKDNFSRNEEGRYQLKNN